MLFSMNNLLHVTHPGYETLHKGSNNESFKCYTSPHPCWLPLTCTPHLLHSLLSGKVYVTLKEKQVRPKWNNGSATEKGCVERSIFTPRLNIFNSLNRPTVVNLFLKSKYMSSLKGTSCHGLSWFIEVLMLNRGKWYNDVSKVGWEYKRGNFNRLS